MSADTNGKTGVREMFLRTIAVIGLLAILILGAWGIIVLATSIPHLFERAGDDVSDLIDGDDDQTSVVVTPAPSAPAAPSSPSAPAKPAAVAAPSTPSSTYVAAASRPALYGSPDLSVSVQGVYAAGSGRTNVQFTIMNIGSNITPSGWSFDVEFPWDDDSYTYRSPAQQALYPGDKIVYTLGLETDSYRRDSRYDDERYEECGRSHRSWDEEDWQDWYEDAFDRSVGSRDDWDTDEWEDWYDDYCDDYDDGRDTRDDGTITITVDPANRIYESNERNNEVSVRQ